MNIGRMFTYGGNNWSMVMLTNNINLVGWSGHKISSFQISMQHYSHLSYTEVK